MKNVLSKFRGLEDMSYEYGYTDISLYENNGRKVYSEMQERTNVKVSRFDYDRIFTNTIGLVNMIIDNKGKMEDDKAYGLLLLCADVFATICDKTELMDWIYEKLTITYEKGFVPLLFQDDVDKLSSIDTLMLLSLDLAMTMGYCSDVTVIAYETIKGEVLYQPLNKGDNNTVQGETTLTEDMKKEFSELYDKCDNGEIDCNEYVNALYDVAESKVPIDKTKQYNPLYGKISVIDYDEYKKMCDDDDDDGINWEGDLE